MVSQFIEPAVCPDIYAHDFANIEILPGGSARFTFYVEQESIYSGRAEKIIVARLVLPICAVPRMARKAANAVTGHFIQSTALHIH